MCFGSVGIGVGKLISIKKKKNEGWEWMVEHSPQILTSEEKSATPAGR